MDVFGTLQTLLTSRKLIRLPSNICSGYIHGLYIGFRCCVFHGWYPHTAFLSCLTILGASICVILFTSHGGNFPLGSVCEIYPRKDPAGEVRITNPVMCDVALKRNAPLGAGKVTMRVRRRRLSCALPYESLFWRKVLVRNGMVQDQFFVAQIQPRPLEDEVSVLERRWT